jgi:ABC transporter substrate binding protein
MMDRRIFLSTMGLSVVAATPGAFAQQQRIWRVGFLALPERPDLLENSRFGAFGRGMRELGYIEGKNLLIEWRFASGETGRLAALAAQLVNLNVDIIVAGGAPVISAAQKATAIIPIVMATSNDPVGSGFVASLGRPGGNTTGLSNLSPDLSPKVVETLLSVEGVPRGHTGKSWQLVQCRDRNQPADCYAGSRPHRPTSGSINSRGHRGCFFQNERGERGCRDRGT